MFVKLSLLWFYLRLDQRGFMKWAVYALSFVVLGLSISSALILTFSCFPPAKFWDLTGTLEGHCMSPSSQQAFYEANGILTIVTDVLIYLTPIPMLWRVQINKVSRASRRLTRNFADIIQRKKIALAGIFGLGILSVAGSLFFDSYIKQELTFLSWMCAI